MTNPVKLAVGAACALLLVGCVNSDRFSDQGPRSYTKIETAPSSPTTKVVTAPLPSTDAVQQTKDNEPKPQQPQDAPVNAQTGGTINHHEPNLD